MPLALRSGDSRLLNAAMLISSWKFEQALGARLLAYSWVFRHAVPPTLLAFSWASPASS